MARVVFAKFWGESIWPIWMGQIGRESFWLGVLSTGGCVGTLNFSAYVGLDPAYTVYQIKISGISGIPK